MRESVPVLHPPLLHLSENGEHNGNGDTNGTEVTYSLAHFNAKQTEITGKNNDEGNKE